MNHFKGGGTLREVGDFNMKNEWISFKQRKPLHYETVLLYCVFIDEVREPLYLLGWFFKGNIITADWAEGVGEIILSKRNDDLFIWRGYTPWVN